MRKTGRIIRSDMPIQVYYDSWGEPVKIHPGDFVYDDVARRLGIDEKYFIHPDSLRIRGAFDFAHRKKGKFIVCIIRDMNGKGDVIMASVIAKALKYKYGEDVKVWFVVKMGYEEILRHCPFVDIVFTSKEEAEASKPDVTFGVNDLEFRTELKDFEREGKVVRNRASIYLHNVELYIENKTPLYVVRPEEKEWAKRHLKKAGLTREKPVIGLQLYGSNITRTYPYMGKVDEILRSKGYQTIYLDSKDEDGKFEFTDVEVAALINEIDLTVTPNSFFYHLSGAMKKRAVALFGSCDGNIWVQDYEKVTAAQIDCPQKKQKCWWSLACLPGGTLREKEVTTTPECLEKIKPEMVVSEIEKHFQAKKVLVVVLTYNLLYLTREMIDSIRSFHNYDILVLDNDSKDGTQSWCKKLGIECISAGTTVPEAWNIAQEEAYRRGYDYVLLCNNDCILSADYVDKVVEVAERRKALAVTGQVVNKNQSTQSQFSELIKGVETTQNIMIAGDYSALLLSRECMEKIGAFREFAPRYQSDEDHLLRLRLYGTGLVKTFATTFYHKHGAVVNELPDVRERRKK